MKNNKQRGITLIALVVTAIVLLILAGITITLVLNQGGIFDKATQAKEKTVIASIREQIRLEILTQITNQNGEELTQREIISMIENNKYGTLNKIEDKYIITTSDQIKVDVTDIVGSGMVSKDVVLYDMGNESLFLGGQWINSPLSAENSVATLTKQKDCLIYQAGNAAATNPILTKQEAIDLTKYFKLNIDMEVVQTGGARWRNIFLSVLDKEGNGLKNEMQYGPNHGMTEPVFNKRQTLSMDISDIKQEAFFGISANSYTIKVYKVWLEK